MINRCNLVSLNFCEDWSVENVINKSPLSQPQARLRDFTTIANLNNATFHEAEIIKKISTYCALVRTKRRISVGKKEPEGKFQVLELVFKIVTKKKHFNGRKCM